MQEVKTKSLFSIHQKVSCGRGMLKVSDGLGTFYRNLLEDAGGRERLVNPIVLSLS